jgi:CheY-like chemotaxis protein
VEVVSLFETLVLYIYFTPAYSITVLSTMTTNSLFFESHPGIDARHDLRDFSTKSPRILIVEDEAICAEDLREILEQSGYIVCSIFSTGEQAVAGVSVLQPDLVLMDIGLGDGIDGIQAAAQITSRSPIPVVFLTAFHDTDTLARAKEINPYGYLVKPFAKETVHTTLQIALAKNLHDNKIRIVSAWLDLTFRNLNRGIVTLDREGKIILMNSCAELHTGRTLDSVYQIPIDEVLHFHDAISKQPYVPFMPAVLTDGLIATFPTDTRLIAKTGEMCRIRDCILLPIQVKDGSIQGAILVFTPECKPDITGLPSDTVKSFIHHDTKIPDRTLHIVDVNAMIKTDLTLERAFLCILLGKFDEAESIYSSLLLRDPGNFKVLHNLGNVLIKLGRHQEALQAFDKALEICPDSTETQRRKADILTILSMKKRR